MRARENTLPQSGKYAGWTEIRGLVRKETKSLSLSQLMAGLPSGLSGRALRAQVRIQLAIFVFFSVRMERSILGIEARVKANTKSTTARKFENVTLCFCNYLSIIQSHYACKMCSNYPRIKLEPAFQR